MRFPLFLAAFWFLIPLTGAQTTGVPGVNDLTLNGLGSGGTSCVTQSAFTGPVVLDFAISGVPGDHVIMAANVLGGGCVPGALPFGAGNSLDLSPGAGFTVWYGSLLGIPMPGPPGLPFATDVILPDGTWSLTISGNLPASLNEISFQGAVVGPTFANGFMMAQAHQVTIFLLASPVPICPNAVSITTIGGMLGDDSSFAYTFVGSTGFPFYGTSHSNVWVNMNGNLSFCSPNGDFSPTATEMANDQPRIAPLWMDLTPDAPTQGDVLIHDDGITFSAEWFDVRHFNNLCEQANGWHDSNNACATLDYGSGLITVDIGDVRRCLPPFGGNAFISDLIVGISGGNTGATCSTPGTGNTATVDLATSFVVNSFTAAPGDPIFEVFDAAQTNPFDLSVPGIGGGSQITLSFMPSGAAGNVYTLF